MHTTYLRLYTHTVRYSMLFLKLIKQCAHFYAYSRLCRILSNYLFFSIPLPFIFVTVCLKILSSPYSSHLVPVHVVVTSAAYAQDATHKHIQMYSINAHDLRMLLHIQSLPHLTTHILTISFFLTTKAHMQDTRSISSQESCPVLEAINLLQAACNRCTTRSSQTQLYFLTQTLPFNCQNPHITH